MNDTLLPPAPPAPKRGIPRPILVALIVAGTLVAFGAIDAVTKTDEPPPVAQNDRVSNDPAVTDPLTHDQELTIYVNATLEAMGPDTLDTFCLADAALGHTQGSLAFREGFGDEVEGFTYREVYDEILTHC